MGDDGPGAAQAGSTGATHRRVQVRVLGPVEAVGRDGRPAALPGPRQRLLLARLAVAAGRAVSADRLLEDVWGGRGSPQVAKVTIGRLRSALAARRGASVIVLGPGGYRLDPTFVDVDALRFEAEVARADRALSTGRALAAANALRRALVLWRDDPYDDVDAAFLAAERERLCALRLTAVENLLDLRLATGDLTVVSELEALVRTHPWRERIATILMRALYADDRQADALAAYQRLRTSLREDLGLDPAPSLQELERAVLQHDPSLRMSKPSLSGISTVGARQGPVTTGDLLGREDDLASVHDLLERNRVVTVVGLGGVGKSRLVRELLATESAELLYVELDHLEPTDDVRSHVAAAAGIEGEGEERIDILAARLGTGDQLVVLDGCERRPEETAQLVEQLVGRCPFLRVLSTSRSPLSVPGEVVFTLAPLATEGPGSPAAQLLADRSGRPYRSLSPAERAAADRIATDVSGLPLALELLAPMAAVLPLAQLERDLREALAAGGRALEPVDDAVRYSLDQLDADTFSVLATLTALPAGFTADAVAALAGTTPHRTLAPLVQHGLLLSFRGPDRSRYRMAEAVRTVAAGRLGPVERAAARRRVVRYLHDVVASVGDGLRRPDLRHLPAAEAEFENIDALLAVGVGSIEGLALAVAAGQAWQEAGRTVTGAAWIERHLDACVDADPLLRGRGLVLLVNMPGYVAHVGLTLDRAEAAAAIAREHGDVRLLTVASGFVAMAAAWAGDRGRADEILTSPESTAVLEELDDPWLWAHRNRLLGLAGALDGEFHRSHASQRRAADVFLELDDPSAAVSALHTAALVARLAGRVHDVEADLRRAVTLAVSGGARRTQALVSYELALLVHERRSPDAPAHLERALDELERVGNLPAAATARRELGVALLRAGQRDAGSWQLRTASRLLLGFDDLGAALAMLELAELHREDGRTAAAASLGAAAARLLRAEHGFGLAAEQQQRVDQVLGELRDHRAFRQGSELTKDGLLDLLVD